MSDVLRRKKDNEEAQPSPSPLDLLRDQGRCNLQEDPQDKLDEDVYQYQNLDENVNLSKDVVHVLQESEYP